MGERLKIIIGEEYDIDLALLMQPGVQNLIKNILMNAAADYLLHKEYTMYEATLEILGAINQKIDGGATQELENDRVVL